MVFIGISITCIINISASSYLKTIRPELSFIIRNNIMKITKIAAIGTLALSIAGLSACNNMMPNKDAATPTPMASESVAKMNIVQVAQSNPDFSILVEAVQAAGLGSMLSEPGAHYTVFAPTNEAFAEVLQETGMTKAQLFANKPLLIKVLGNHVISGDMAMYAKDVKPGNVMTVSQDTLIVTPEGMLTDEMGRTANIVKTDIAATNGVVHVIDKVLLPK